MHTLWLRGYYLYCCTGMQSLYMSADARHAAVHWDGAVPSWFPLPVSAHYMQHCYTNMKGRVFMLTLATAQVMPS